MFSYKEVLQKFTEIYSENCLVVKSPGRINLLGEHVDYNDGFVMPASINFSTVFCIAEASDGITEIFSMKYNEFHIVQLDLQNISPVAEPGWANYLLGVLHQLVKEGFPVKPFKCVFGGNIPLGAGLSSSASIECGFAYALNELYELRIEKIRLIKMAQWAEHNYVGVKCGIMDQFASMMGDDDKVIVLDCQSLDYDYSPLQLTQHSLVLCDTKVKHSLVDSEYNKRRAECEEGLKLLSEIFPFVKSFRDVTQTMLVAFRSSFPPGVFQRCLYVVQEINRVQDAKEDLRNLKLEEFGKKMFETHEGLSRLYEVSCPELDFLVNEARQFSGVVGSRMMGGGFGGCTINIVENNCIKDFIDTTSVNYRNAFGKPLVTYKVSIEKGTHVIDLPLDILKTK